MVEVTSSTGPMAGRASFSSDQAVLRKGQETVGREVSESTEETSSGQKSGGYAGKEIAENTRKVLSSEQGGITGSADQGKIEKLTGDITLAFGANESLQKIASNFHARVTAAQAGGKKDNNFPDFCKDMLGQVENILNKKRFDGRSLFGGNATRSDAVRLSDADIPAVGDQPDANYKEYFKGEVPKPGEDSKHHSTVNDEAVEYGFSALDPGARDLIFWLKSGSVTTPDGDPESPNGKRLAGMQNGLHKVTEALSDTKKIVGEQLGNLERISQDVETKLAFSKDTLSELTDADLLEQLTRRTQAMMMQQLMMHMQSASTKDFQNLINNI